jgi:hypothetical protein
MMTNFGPRLAGIGLAAIALAGAAASTASAATPGDVHYGTAHEWKATGVGGAYRTCGAWAYGP